MVRFAVCFMVVDSERKTSIEGEVWQKVLNISRRELEKRRKRDG